MKRKKIVIIFSLALFISTGYFLLIKSPLKNNSQSLNNIKLIVEDKSIGAQYTDSSLFLSAIKQNKIVAATGKITGLIVPHHLLAINLMADAFAYSSTGKYQNIVLLSPDHFSAGQKEISVTERNFSTVFGEVKTDQKISNKLKELKFIGDGDFFYREHGVQAILPFIRYYFPDTKITVITFKPTVSRFQLDQMLEVLKKELPLDSLIIQSTDFSHYLAPIPAAQFDDISIKALESANLENILALKQPDNLDSVAALYVQASLQKHFFQAQVDILEHKNSQDYTTLKVVSSTSYISAIYSKENKGVGNAEFIFVGDVMLSRYIGELMEKRQNYNFPFEKIKPFFTGADLVFGNLESPISSSGKSTGSLYPFRTDPRAVLGLKDAGFTVLSVANNHAYDYGTEAFLATLTNLKNVGLLYAGGGNNFKEAHNGSFSEINGIKTTILAYTDLLPESESAQGDEPGFTYLDQEQMIKDIKVAKERSDLVIVSFHWGREYETTSNNHQEQIAMAAVTAGASLIVGHHPHVTQEINQIQGVTVAYSLGNFVFDQNFSEDTKNGTVLKVIVKDKKIKSVTPSIIKFNSNFQPYLFTTPSI